MCLGSLQRKKKSEENLDSLTLCFFFMLSIFTVRRRQKQVGSVEFNSMPDKRETKLLCKKFWRVIQGL